LYAMAAGNKAWQPTTVWKEQLDQCRACSAETCISGRVAGVVVRLAGHSRLSSASGLSWARYHMHGCCHTCFVTWQQALSEQRHSRNLCHHTLRQPTTIAPPATLVFMHGGCPSHDPPASQVVCRAISVLVPTTTWVVHTHSAT
jgi:hypothetical protein